MFDDVLGEQLLRSTLLQPCLMPAAWLLGCSSQRANGFSGQAAKKSAREETFDAMEYVDSKVPAASW